MSAKPRKLTISRYDDHPRLLLAGIWLDRSGFKPGDKVVVTNPEPGQLIVHVETPAELATDTGEIPPALPLSNVAEPETPFYTSLLIPKLPAAI